MVGQTHYQTHVPVWFCELTPCPACLILPPSFPYALYSHTPHLHCRPPRLLLHPGLVRTQPLGQQSGEATAVAAIPRRPTGRNC